jgi:hypothetical protein
MPHSSKEFWRRRHDFDEEAALQISNVPGETKGLPTNSQSIDESLASYLT